MGLVVEATPPTRMVLSSTPGACTGTFSSMGSSSTSA